jgi:hypothetical protein
VTGDSTQLLALLFITQAVVVELLQIMEPLLNREALVAVVKATSTLALPKIVPLLEQ